MGYTLDQIQRVQKQTGKTLPVSTPASKPAAPESTSGGGVFNKVANVAQGVQDFAVGAAKGVANTVKGSLNLVAKGMESVAPAPKGSVPSAMQSVEAAIPQGAIEPKNAAEKAGFVTEQIAEFFIPSSAITKVNKAVSGSKLLAKIPETAQKTRGAIQLAAKAGTEAVVAGTQTAMQGGKTSDVASNAGWAALFPVATKGLSVLVNEGIPWAATVSTGLNKSDLVLAKNHPEAMKQAIEHVTENQQQPFYSLANTLGNRLKTAWDDAGKAYEAGVQQLGQTLGTKGYNVSRRLDDLAEPLRKSNLGLTITKKQANAAPMAVNRVKVLSNPQTPFTTREIGVLDDLVNTVHQSRNISLNDVIDLSRKFARAYDAVPLSNDGKATPFHVLVLKLQDKFDEILGDTIPELKPVNEAYRVVRDVWKDFGPQLVDADGAVKQGAESFLQNLGNRNKGAARRNLKALEALTGVPIEDNVMLLRSAERLNNLFPATGSRTQDVIRALGISGAGFAAGGGLGSILAAAASSPSLAGKVAMLLGKYGKKIRVPEGAERFLGQ